MSLVTMVDSVTIVLRAAYVAIPAGAIAYFAIRWACSQVHAGEGYYRLGLTIISLALICSPEIKNLFGMDSPQTFLEMMEMSMTPEMLWLSIKAKIVLGLVGHGAGAYGWYKLSR